MTSGSGAPVASTAMSLAARQAARSPRSATAAPAAASRSACRRVRLHTVTAACCAAALATTIAATWPAPTTSSRWPAIEPPPALVTASTATLATDRVAAVSEVSRCRFRDARIAASISRPSTASPRPADWLMLAAARTCPAISVSPSTNDSRPLATRSRCRAAASPA